MGTRKLVAERAGVSEATVSRVLNGLSVVKPGTRAKVLEAVEALGYHPNAIAQSFARGLSGNIGVVLPHIPKVHLFSTHYFAEICSGIGTEVDRRGFHMLMLFQKVDDGEALLRAYETRKVDGCIVLGATKETKGIEALRDAGCPLCFVSHRDEDESSSYVDSDNVNGARMATAHLIRNGHTRIAYLNGPMIYTNSIDRLEGYQLALSEAGLAYDENLVLEGNYSRTSGYHTVHKLLSLRPSPTAIFAGNDRMAAGLVLGLRETGLRAGQDLAIVSYDDADIATITDPPLSTVRVPFFEMGEQAAGILADQIDAQSTNGVKKVHLPAEFIVRQSCGQMNARTLSPDAERV